METIHVRSMLFDYDVMVGRNIMAELPNLISAIDSGGAMVVVTDDGVDSHFPELPSLQSASHRIVLNSGEQLKSFANAQSLVEKLTEWKMARDGLLVAFGGGVVGDLTGFVASIYLRGIAWVVVPTTLLSQVDSSIGGKVAVNLPAGKNLVGAFYPPRLVLSDVSLLSQLPESEFISGLGEVIKTALIGDPQLFELLEQRLDAVLARDLDILQYMVSACARVKAGVVSRDERDTGERAILNFGHTIAHAIEGAEGFGQLPHGIAVLYGIQVALRLSEECCGLPTATGDRIRKLIQKLPIDPKSSLPPFESLESFLIHDKKVRSSQQGAPCRWALLREIGKPVTGVTIPPAQVSSAYKSLWSM
jgi:3-dehydroquinate synthase